MGNELSNADIAMRIGRKRVDDKLKEKADA